MTEIYLHIVARIHGRLYIFIRLCGGAGSGGETSLVEALRSSSARLSAITARSQASKAAAAAQEQQRLEHARNNM